MKTYKEGDWRKCPSCEKGTLSWVELDYYAFWSCPCGHEECMPEDWSIKVPKGMKFVEDDEDDNLKTFIWDGTRRNYIIE